jgi:hypothetical protein
MESRLTDEDWRTFSYTRAGKTEGQNGVLFHKYQCSSQKPAFRACPGTQTRIQATASQSGDSAGPPAPGFCSSGRRREEAYRDSGRRRGQGNRTGTSHAGTLLLKGQRRPASSTHNQLPPTTPVTSFRNQHQDLYRHAGHRGDIEVLRGKSGTPPARPRAGFLLQARRREKRSVIWAAHSMGCDAPSNRASQAVGGQRSGQDQVPGKTAPQPVPGSSHPCRFTSIKRQV